jgi:hypothetical protein
MQLDKSQVLDMLKSRGDNDQASKAASELPNKVDTDQHADLLSKFGINPQDLLGKITGGI